MWFPMAKLSLTLEQPGNATVSNQTVFSFLSSNRLFWLSFRYPHRSSLQPLVYQRMTDLITMLSIVVIVLILYAQR